MATSRIQHSTKTIDYKTIKVEKIMNEAIYLDPNHYQTSQIVDSIQQGLFQKQQLDLVTSLNTEFGKEGNQFYYLYGDLATGIAGFGDTASNALHDFWMNWHNQKA